MKFKNIKEVEEKCTKEDKKYIVYNNSVLDVREFNHPGP